jgi:hypothetical protein
MIYEEMLFRMRAGFEKGGGTPPLVAPAAPPPSATAMEVAMAKRDTMRNAQRRKGMQSTVLAGALNTGSQPGMPGAGTKTTLGG